MAILNRWARPVDGASLAFVRIAMGAVLFWEVCRFISYGWISRYYLQPNLFFHYYGFEWIQPWAGLGMYLHFLVLGVLALGLMVGWHARFCALLLGVGWSFVFLQDQSNYLNHLYLVCLLCFMLAITPTDRVCAVQASGPQTVPAWALGILRFQVGVVYFFGGIAKLNPDWLIGQPLRMWMGARGDMFLVGPLLTEPVVAIALSYAGLLVDLLVVPGLMWRRTRKLSFTVVVVFNLANAGLFSIGIFPWLMMALTTVFFEPGWPRRVWPRWFDEQPPVLEGGGFSSRLKAFWLVWIAIQLALPLRHWIYPGNVSWTEEGHRFSWHMKLRSKRGKVIFHALDTQTGETWRFDPADNLTKRQRRKMVTRPDMILQYAHHLRERLGEEGHPQVAVHVDAHARLNGRGMQPFIDPEVNLAEVPRTLLPADWILPLQE